MTQQDSPYDRLSLLNAAGRYSFDGTACPWGGILAGALEQITGQRFSCTPRLTPGDVCEIDLRRAG